MSKQEKEKKFPKIKRRTVLKEVPSGQIVIEEGADGVYLRYECECEDAIPYCRSACCSLRDIEVNINEISGVNKSAKKLEGKVHLPVVILNPDTDDYEMRKSSDSWCSCLDRSSRACNIYEARPGTCRDFHCTNNVNSRGWRLEFVRMDIENKEDE